MWSRYLHAGQWRHNERDGVPNHQPYDCLLNRLFRRKSKKTSKLRVAVLCDGNSSVTGEFPAQRASNAENVSIWWRHHVIFNTKLHYRLRYVSLYPQKWNVTKIVLREIIISIIKTTKGNILGIGHYNQCRYIYSPSLHRMYKYSLLMHGIKF